MAARASIKARVRMATGGLREPNVRKAFKVLIKEVIVLVKEAFSF